MHTHTHTHTYTPSPSLHHTLNQCLLQDYYFFSNTSLESPNTKAKTEWLLLQWDITAYHLGKIPQCPMPPFFCIKLTIFLFSTCQRWPCQKMCTLLCLIPIRIKHSVLTICLFWSFSSIVLKNHSHICVLDLCLWLTLPDGHTFFTFLTGQY